MDTPRFRPEFKEDAVCQITERGYSIAEVSAPDAVSSCTIASGDVSAPENVFVD